VGGQPLKNFTPMKSKQSLETFIEYCIDHPEQRFWQALRNWAKAGAIIFIDERDWKKRDLSCTQVPSTILRDTFYRE